MAELQMPVSASDHARGAHAAPVTLVIYGDYECPYTRRAYRGVQSLLTDLPDQLRFVFRHFPLITIHPHAEHAAEAAEAAAAQEKFWEMHDALFDHQRALEDADLRRYAEDITLDVERFADDVGAHTYAQHILDDLRSGLASGVQGTPTLYFNGQLHIGGYDDETLRATIAEIAGNDGRSA